MLSYYIATQTVEEHLRFLFIEVFFLNCGFLIFLEKQNATHSSSKPRLVERDFCFENVRRGPYKELAHTIDRTCLFTVGKSLAGTGRGEER